MRLLQIIIGGLVLLTTFVAMGYIAIWWGIVEPIMTIADAVDNDTISASLVAWEVCKFFLKELLAGIVGWIGFTIGMLIISYDI